MAVIDRLNVNQTPAFLKDGVFDISEYNNGAVYTDLSDALGQNGINIPPTIRKGGMSVKFIQSSDDGNKYIQYKLTSQNWSTNTDDWQSLNVDDEPIANSINVPKSSGVHDMIAEESTIGKKSLSLYKDFGGFSKKQYSLIHTDGTVQNKPGSYTCYGHLVLVNKGVILCFSGHTTERARVTIGITTTPITESNFADITYEIIYNKFFDGGCEGKVIVPYDGYIISYRYTSNWDLFNGISVFNSTRLQDNSVLDVSELNNSNYASLSDALSVIPANLQKGGMEIKYYQVVPATYKVIKDDGVTTEPTGIQLNDVPSINSGIYTADYLNVFGTLPDSTSSGAIVYYVEVTETVNEVETTTYTTWNITMISAEESEYVQYRLMSATWSDNINNWQGVDKKVTSSRNLVESRAVANAIAESSKYKESVDIDSLPRLDYQINATGKWNATESAKHIIVPVNAGEKYIITANDEKFTRYAFLTSDVVTIYEDAPFVTGTGLYTIAASDNAIIEIPDTCIYLYLLDTYWVNSTADTGYLPKSVEIVESIADVALVKKAQTLTDDEKRQVKKNIDIDTDLSLVGNNNNLVAGRFYRVKAGNTYRVWIKYPSIDCSGVTTRGFSKRMEIGYLVNGESSGVYPIQVMCTTIDEGYDLADYYDITLPSELDISCLRINMRATAGEEQIFIVEDITSINDILSGNKNTYLGSVILKFNGLGDTFNRSSFCYPKPGSVLKFKLRDTEVPHMTDYKAFTISSRDANNVTSELIIVYGNQTIQSEYTVIVPEDSVKMYIGGRALAGYSYICDVIDVSDEYEVKHITSDDFYLYLNNKKYNRAETRFVVSNNSILQIQSKDTDMSFEYQATGYNINNHVATGTTLSSWSKDTQNLSLDAYDFCKIQLRNDDAILSHSDFDVFTTTVNIILATKRNTISDRIDNSEQMKLYGLRINSNNVAVTDYITKPMQNMKLHIILPIWMKVRFYGGLRNNRSYTDYYYNGDIVEFDYLKGFISPEISHISNINPELYCYEHLYEMGAIKFIIQDWKCKEVIDRNFSAEKYLGAIRTTPNQLIDLPVIVHTSDIHGDAFRFNSAFEYADYLNADLMVNTGDNCFYLLDDGTNFIKEVANNHKTDFATCLGNHDTYTSPLSNVYNKAIAPFAEIYNYHKLNDTDITDKCYYYKDLSEKSLRIIALDIYEDVLTSNYRARVSQTQIEWFIDTLGSTPEGYGVIILLHQVPHTLTSIPNHINFNDMTSMDKGNVSANEWQCYGIDSDKMINSKLTGNPFGKIIDAFISRGTVSDSYNQQESDKSTPETITYSADFSNIADGVEFIMYLNGHTHRDFVGYLSNCTHNQLNINVCSANPFAQSSGFKSPADIYRDDRANQDAFNVYTINRTDKTVGIARIGSNLSKDLIDRKVMFVSYVDEV